MSNAANLMVGCAIFGYGFGALMSRWAGPPKSIATILIIWFVAMVFLAHGGPANG